MFTLFLLLAQRVGTIFILAFLLVNVPFFRRLLSDTERFKTKLILIAVFSVFALVSNFTGIEINGHNNLLPTTFLTEISIHDSIANTRTLAITVAGLCGGPLVGSAVGLIAGIHRVFQGSGSDIFYVPSSFVIGFLSGTIGRFYSHKKILPGAGPSFLTGVCMEMIQMLFIFLFSPSGPRLVSLIFFPMTLLNSFGTWIFISIIKAYLHQQDQLKALQTHDILFLANKTLPFFSAGLNPKSAKKAAEIIEHNTNFDAIGITDKENVLAHVGLGADHHRSDRPIVTKLSKRVLSTGKMELAHSKEEIGCPVKGCPLSAAIVIPLTVGGKILGTLKMYFKDQHDLTSVEEQLASGLAAIFSSQLALGMAEEQSKLAKDAKIKSLQAQVNPHFFFNAINTISALMRTNNEKAHQLLLELSKYFRTNLQGMRETEITLQQEFDHLQAYLSLEQTRFPGRFLIDFDVKCSQFILLPPFTIQVLVENAIKHAFVGRKKGNKIKISIGEEDGFIKILVSDNGIGIKPSLIPKLGKETILATKGSGTALENLNQRLVGLYGSSSALHFKSGKEGTCINISIPKKEVS